MMRLQSETEQSPVEPLQLSEGRAHRPREIVRLEFRSAGPTPVQTAAGSLSIKAVDEEPGISVEMDELHKQLKSQREVFQSQIDEARRNAAEIARTECYEEFERKIGIERDRVVRFMAQFDRERRHYFASAEAEVVKLSLAIAAHILHREVRLDPLLLKGVVRVALEQVEDDSAVVLRVAGSEVERWHRAISEEKDLTVKVVGDSRLAEGECLLESNVGSVDLGIPAQLKEIERGFFDLLEKRPA